MGDVSSAPRDEPSTCRALRAQRRPRGTARTRGHGAPTPANRFAIAVATGCISVGVETDTRKILVLIMTKTGTAGRMSRIENRKGVRT
jgi:hypothetical protein